MSVKSTVKIILDVIMTLLMASLFFINFTGLVFHEIAGIGILLLFGFHLYLNKKYITGISRKLFVIKQKIKGKTLFMYLLSIELFISVCAVAITGFMISSVVLPFNEYNYFLITAHKISAYITAFIVAVHLSLHASYLLNSFKKLFSSRTFLKGLSGIFASITIITIIYCYTLIGLNEKTVNANPIPASVSKKNNETYIASGTPKKEEEAELLNSSESQEINISPTEFLSKMFCNICPKHCPLSSPRCNKSSQLIKQAKAEYQSLYGEQ